MTPWTRQPKETPQAFAAFEAYLHAGQKRSTRQVARLLHRSRTLMGRWSRKWRWPARARAWDEDQEAITRKAREAAAKAVAVDWAKRQETIRDSDWDAAQMLRSKAKAMMEFPLAKQVIKRGGQEVHIYPARWTMEGAARMMDCASDLERRAAGKATVKIEVSGPDGGRIELEHKSVEAKTGFDFDAYNRLLLSILQVPEGNGAGQPVHPTGPDTEAGDIPQPGRS
jgi:hypothetical protein